MAVDAIRHRRHLAHAKDIHAAAGILAVQSLQIAQGLVGDRRQIRFAHVSDAGAVGKLLVLLSAGESADPEDLVSRRPERRQLGPHHERLSVMMRHAKTGYLFGQRPGNALVADVQVRLGRVPAVEPLDVEHQFAVGRADRSGRVEAPEPGGFNRERLTARRDDARRFGGLNIADREAEQGRVNDARSRRQS